MLRKSRRKIEKRIVSYLNSLSVRRKLLVLYVFCVLIPLIVTDGFIIGMFVTVFSVFFHVLFRT